MRRILFIAGLALMALPFAVMLCEVAYAHGVGATGERLAAAGFWGVFVGFITFIPGLVLTAISLVMWFLNVGE